MIKSFQREKMTADFIEVMNPLAEKHYREIAHYQDIPLVPNWQLYMSLEKDGVLRLFTVRNELWDLVGYGIFVVKNNLHYWTSVQASQDVIFLDKSARGYNTGAEFIAWCDEQLRIEGVQAVFHHVKAKANFGPKILEPLGYELIDMIYGRRLDK